MTLEEYYQKYQTKITQNSERLFVDDFLYPLLGSKIEQIEPQYVFIDRTGHSRRIDFAYIGKNYKLAFEVNGETYHAEGIIPNEMFDDNLFRQNEILASGYKLVRYSYNQLQSPQWRQIIQDSLREFISDYASELLTEFALKPLPVQIQALEALHFYRHQRQWKKGIVVMPTGTGKTILSALDAQLHGGKVLFLVHRLDILRQSIDAYKKVFPNLKHGILTGEQKENVTNCDVLFASKDTLRKPEQLKQFTEDYFNYIVIDEVHHTQSPTYKEIVTYFNPSFMLGMTATPDRTDRKDIFELFDYQKIYEISLVEAIEQGYLVPYTYYGLQDNVDYSNIRYQNNKYRESDLENLLIVPERNEAIIKEYLDKGKSNKAIGFCVTQKHADRMAEAFRNHGISAEAIYSGKPNREDLIVQFRQNQIQVVFTVDLFNEGVDFPNVRVLLFLRPTESKTVFLQQLGRGLRLCTGKNRVIVLDFIANYKRANQIRKYLAQSSNAVNETNQTGGKKKIEYQYSTGCEVYFDPSVEEILDRQDAEALGITKEELIEAYFKLAERLERKPNKIDLDQEGEYKSAQYISVFGGWVQFLKEIGEFTEASYHYPQGTDLGHILSILKYFGQGNRQGTHFDNKYICFRGNLESERLGSYQRQVKYKLQASMELDIITDYRNYATQENYEPELTAQGQNLYQLLKPELDNLDLSFPFDNDGIPSTRISNTINHNQFIKRQIENNSIVKDAILKVFLNMSAVQQMLAFIYHICRKQEISKEEIYEQFFQSPFVKRFCDSEGIEIATSEASKRRCPFLLNILEACGIITNQSKTIIVNKLVLTSYLVRSNLLEDQQILRNRLNKVIDNWLSQTIGDSDMIILKELFGSQFMTDSYFLSNLTTITKINEDLFIIE